VSASPQFAGDAHIHRTKAAMGDQSLEVSLSFYHKPQLPLVFRPSNYFASQALNGRSGLVPPAIERCDS